MLQTLKNRRAEARNNDKGFTLIELMVVVLIIAILIAVAIPTFLGMRRNAQNVAAKQSATTSLKAAKAIFSDEDSYASVTPAELRAAEASVAYVDGSTASDGSKVASVDVPDAFTFVAAVYSDSGTCFFIQDDLSGTTYATLNTGTADCYAANADVVFGASWP
jgi:type IV pilus assembly protein PilA